MILKLQSKRKESMASDLFDAFRIQAELDLKRSEEEPKERRDMCEMERQERREAGQARIEQEERRHVTMMEAVQRQKRWEDIERKQR